MIEEKIDSLIAAIDRLTEALGANVPASPVASADPAPVTKRRKPAPAPVATPAPEPEAVAPSGPDLLMAELYRHAAAAAEAPATVAEPTLRDLRAAAQQALDAGKLDGVVAINTEYGLKRISDAAVEQYPQILAKLVALSEVSHG